MRITDELRKYVQSWRETPNLMDDLDAGDIDGLLGDFEHIADRIDAEYERKVGCTDDEWDHWESTHVELPKDGDGVHIRIGDVMEARGSGETFEVRSMQRDEYGWEVYDRLGGSYAPTLLRHHRAPTVEDVLREFGTGWYERMSGPGTFDIAEYVERYADKLRLAKGADA